MTCPHCKLENIPAASTCDCGYYFATGTVHKPTIAKRPTTEGTKRSDPRIVWIVLGIATIVSVLSIAPVPFDHNSTWGVLTIAYGTIFVFCIYYRVRTRSKAAGVAIAISALLCLFCFMQWAAWYQ